MATREPGFPNDTLETGENQLNEVHALQDEGMSSVGHFLAHLLKPAMLASGSQRVSISCLIED